MKITVKKCWWFLRLDFEVLFTLPNLPFDLICVGPVQDNIQRVLSPLQPSVVFECFPVVRISEECQIFLCFMILTHIYFSYKQNWLLGSWILNWSITNWMMSSTELSFVTWRQGNEEKWGITLVTLYRDVVSGLSLKFELSSQFLRCWITNL